MATSRERLLQTLEFRRAVPPWLPATYGWQQTMTLWREQGWDGRPLEEIFDLDRWQRVDPYYGPVPRFSYEVIEEDEATITYINYEGILMREFKANREASMPQFVRYPVESEADFENLRGERLVLNAEERFPAQWRQQAITTGVQGHVSQDLYSQETAHALSSGQVHSEERPRLCFADRWGGFFGPLRNLMGLENLCFAFYDQPKLVERMMAERADAIIAITAEVLKHTHFEVFAFWEDMAYKAGPLVGPDMFRRFAFPHYQRVCDWLRRQGIQHIGLDSDGDIRGLIPIWLDAGIDFLWPFEVQSGMDVNAIRAQYGYELTMMGGIDKKAIAVGGEVMQQEVDRVMPVVEDGGYLPALDHSAPPDISWQNYCDYVAYLRFRLGRG